MHVPGRKLGFVFAFIAVAWLVWGNLRSSGQDHAADRPVRWEYRIEESHMSPELLNRCGKDGWELVNTLQTSNDNGIVYHFLFKRAR